MSASMTYTSLVTTLQQWLDRSDATLIANIPQFISDAEFRIARELKILGFITVVQSTFTPGEAIVSKPQGWRETVSMRCGTGTGNNTSSPMFVRNYEYLRTYWPDSTQTGTPKYYSDYDQDHWLVAPTPATNAPFECVYYARVKPLDDTNQTNVLTEYAPDMLLYAALLESAPYLKNDDRIQVWQQRYDRCLQAEVLQDTRQLIDRSQAATENRG